MVHWGIKGLAKQIPWNLLLLFLNLSSQAQCGLGERGGNRLASLQSHQYGGPHESVQSLQSVAPVNHKGLLGSLEHLVSFS